MAATDASDWLYKHAADNQFIYKLFSAYSLCRQLAYPRLRVGQLSTFGIDIRAYVKTAV